MARQDDLAQALKQALADNNDALATSIRAEMDELHGTVSEETPAFRPPAVPPPSMGPRPPAPPPAVPLAGPLTMYPHQWAAAGFPMSAAGPVLAPMAKMVLPPQAQGPPIHGPPAPPVPAFGGRGPDAVDQGSLDQARAANETAARLQREQTAAVAASAQKLVDESRERVARKKAEEEVTKRQREQAEALARSSSGLGRFSGAVGDVFKGANDMRAAFNMTVGSMRGLVVAASPTAMGTFDKSLTLASAHVGTYLLPAINSLSYSLQHFSRVMDAVPGGAQKGAQNFLQGTIERAGADPFSRALDAGGAGSWIRKKIGSTMAGGDDEYEKRMAGARMGFEHAAQTRLGQTWLGKGAIWAGRTAAGLDTKKPLEIDYAGMPKPQMMGYEQYGQSLQMAALQQSPLDAKILEKQLANLDAMGGLLKDIEASTRYLRNAFPAWR